MPSAAKTVSPEGFYGVEPPDVSGIVTEDDTPLDNFASEKQQRLLTEPLYSSWSGPPPLEDAEEPGTPRTFVAAANVGVFITPEDPPLVPDAFLSLDVELAEDIWKKENRTYFIWKMGKPPNVVVEIVSNREGEELGKKRLKYAKWGIPYYVVWDPQGLLGEPKLRAFALGGDLYLRMDQASFPRVGLSLVTWEGTYEGKHDIWLRWADLDGKLIPTGAERAEEERKRAEDERKRAEDERKRAEEQHKRAEDERKRAEEQHKRAEEQHKRADAAQARADRLAEKLRALGIDPNGDG